MTFGHSNTAKLFNILLSFKTAFTRFGWARLLTSQ